MDNICDIPAGRHRCRVISAQKTKSRAGNDMLLIRLEIYGCYDILTHFITFIPERPEIASRNLREFFGAFPSLENNFETSTWRGHEGACRVEKTNEGHFGKTKIVDFIPYAEQVGLPHFNDAPGSGVVVYDVDLN